MFLVGIIVERVEVMVCDAGPKAGKPRSLGLVRLVDGGRFSAPDLVRLRMFALRHDARWFGKAALAQRLGLRILPLQHQDADKAAADVEAFAKLLSDKIAELAA